MQVDYLIIGQGISGTMLSWYLFKEGKTFLVIDEPKHGAASVVAGGLINPVTGRRYSTSWMIDTLMPFAHEAYNELGNYLGLHLIDKKSVIDFFPSPQMRKAFVDRVQEDDTYLSAFPDQNHFNQYFNYDFGCGEISPAYVVQLSTLLAAWRNKLKEKNQLLEDHFEMSALRVIESGVQYENLTASAIIFCEGSTAVDNPWFQLLPFAPNKGEALIIETEGLTNQYVYKKGMILSPLPTENTYWVGSNFLWEFENANPTPEFLESTTAQLKHWIKAPFRVLDHLAAIRPATVERRPFVGMHPHQQQVGMLNGMGTKGSSLAPFFANALTQHLVHGLPIPPEADISRFTRILSK